MTIGSAQKKAGKLETGDEEGGCQDPEEILDQVMFFRGRVRFAHVLYGSR